jgi:response regulator RpfG family c-di-GMP phosphodiesterase
MANESPAANQASPVTPANKPTLLLVDDESSILTALQRLFRPHGYRIFTAESGPAGLAILENETVDVVVSDMRMPGMDGAQFLEQVFSRWPDTKRILLTGYSDAGATVAAINQGKIWRYVSKPWNDDEILVTVGQALAHRQLMHENVRLTRLTRQQNEELKELNANLEQKVSERTAELAAANQQLRQGFLNTVQLFSNLIEIRGGKLAGHSRRVADLARRLAEHMSLTDADLQDVFLAALLHDIGKLGLPDNLLNAAFNALPPQSRSEVMHHPAKGQQLLMAVEQLAKAARLIRHHHEYYDGSGYPDRLKGLSIPLGARILAVANDYDALQIGVLTLHPHSPLEAQQYILKERGRRYDPQVVDAFFAMLAEDAAKYPKELALRPADLRPGMVLTRDLMHAEGYTLLPRGRVLNAESIAQLRLMETEEKLALTLHIRNDAAPNVLRDQPAEIPRPGWREAMISANRLKPGMVLARSVVDKNDGYLLLARGSRLDEALIKQIREYELLKDISFNLYIRVDDR